MQRNSFVEKTIDLLYDGINLLIIDPFLPGPRVRRVSTKKSGMKSLMNHLSFLPVAA
ncbi:MAG: hypothetical protein R3C56_08150 [Pirellulaceae bacterium]